MSLIQIILLIIVVPITLLNIRFIVKEQKEKQISQRKCRAAVSVLSMHEKELGGSGNYTAAKYVSDIGNNYFVCRSKVYDIGALVTESDFFLLEPLSSVGCEIVVEKEGMKIKSIACNVSSPSLDNEIIVPLAENSHNYRGIGSMILEIAEDFKDELCGNKLTFK